MVTFVNVNLNSHNVYKYRYIWNLLFYCVVKVGGKTQVYQILLNHDFYNLYLWVKISESWFWVISYLIIIKDEFTHNFLPVDKEKRLCRCGHTLWWPNILTKMSWYGLLKSQILQHHEHDRYFIMPEHFIIIRILFKMCIDEFTSLCGLQTVISSSFFERVISYLLVLVPL